MYNNLKNVGINLTKEVKYSYTENFKTMRKKIRTLENGEASRTQGLIENQFCPFLQKSVG